MSTKLIANSVTFQTFRIDGSGLSQVKSHACSSSHKKQVVNFSTQRTFSTNADFVPYLFGDKLSHTDLVAKAEIIQALKFADSNYSFASASDDNARFAAMFPDSKIAQSYEQSETKVMYCLKFGLAPYIKGQLMSEFTNSTPFTFKFDETTNRQVEKQFDGYLQFWSRRHNKVITAYVGSLHLGHCTADQMVEHFHTYIKDLKLNVCLLLHLGMDGPNVNISA